MPPNPSSPSLSSSIAPSPPSSSSPKGPAPAGRRGVFVTGTGTDVGKTVVSACLVRALGADYWKPVQSGLALGADTQAVIDLAGLEQASIDLAGLDPVDGLPEARDHGEVPRAHGEVHRLQAPLSPHLAARLEGVSIHLDEFHLPPGDRPLVVEGAGGLLVPLNDRDLMIDLMAQLGLPVVLVALSGLGTINHTLLSLEALRHRALSVAGVILNGPANEENRKAIEHFGRVKVVAEVPTLEPLTAAMVAELVATRFSSGFLADFMAGSSAGSETGSLE